MLKNNNLPRLSVTSFPRSEYMEAKTCINIVRTLLCLILTLETFATKLNHHEILNVNQLYMEQLKRAAMVCRVN